MTYSDGCEFRQILRDTVKQRLADEPVALLFSGGTDSLTVLWTLLDLGAQVTCYTFRLRDVESTDAKVSALACRHWGVPQVVVTEGADVAADTQSVIRVIKSARKTHVEVMYAYWHLLREVKESQVWSGLQADTLYGSNKKSAIAHGKTGPEQFAEFRRNLLRDPGQEGLAQAQAVASYYGKELCAPYATEAVREWFMRWRWADLNKPKQKMPAILGFNDRFHELPIYRIDDNLQCGSGIREHMARAYNGHQRQVYQRMLGDVRCKTT
jgi:asparagine synthetase B (glutamine-hydrolysing)